MQIKTLLDWAGIQAMVEANYAASGMPIGIIDAVDGSVLAGAGWQRICTEFHRKNPVSAKRCRESDASIKDNIQDGRPFAYKCKNGMWDIGIPILVSGVHVATLFLGQFFFEDELVDEDYFIRQADEFGFDVVSYLEALRAVPRFSREKADNILKYNVAFAGFLAGFAEESIRVDREVAIHRRLEEENVQRKLLLEKFVSVSPSPVFVKDAKGVYTECNDAFLSLIGLKREELIGKSVFDLYPRELAQIYYDHDREVFGKPHLQVYESKVKGASGEIHHVIFNKAALVDADGAVSGLIGIVTIVDELKSVQAELKKAKEESEKANIAKSQFLANMSHEIRTPLNGVYSMLQLLQVTTLTGEQDLFVQAALKSSSRLAQLLTDILDISRIEAGKMLIVNSPFGLGSIRQSILELFGIAAKEKNLDFSFDIEPGLPDRLYGDETRLHQILFNLVGNAVKFTESGSVRVFASPIATPDGRLLRVLFLVADTGIGITDEQIASIFDPFVQAEETYTKRYQGAGLGLAIVKKLVNLLGGALTIDSRPGEGTDIYLSLPFAEAGEQAKTKPSPPPLAASASQSLRILLVEDDSVSLLSARRMLEKAGHTVQTARDGKEALDILKAQDFDIVFMDIQMPVMDGLEAARAIRTGAEFAAKSRIPIVAMTAYAMSGDKEQFLAAGLDDYLSKPVEMSTLAEVIARITGKAADG